MGPCTSDVIPEQDKETWNIAYVILWLTENIYINHHTEYDHAGITLRLYQSC